MIQRRIIELLLLINRKLDYIIGKEIKMENTLDATLADVQSESTVIDGLITLTAGIKSQLDAVLAGALTPDQQAKVDAIFAAVEENKEKVSAAITANTPAAPASPASPAEPASPAAPETPPEAPAPGQS